MNRRLATLFLFALCAASCGVEEDRTSVLLVTVDTLRADHLGAYGATDVATPNVDRLACGLTSGIGPRRLRASSVAPGRPR